MLTTTPLMLTGDVSRALDVSPEMVRYLERTGRLTAVRTGRGTRVFDRAQVEQFAREREGRKADVTTVDEDRRAAVGERITA